MINYLCDQYRLFGDMEETLDFLEDEIDFTRKDKNPCNIAPE